MKLNPEAFNKGDKRRDAAIVSAYMSLANGGGINGFLTSSYNWDAHDVFASFEALGARVPADEFRSILDRLREPIPVASETERWNKLMDLWAEELDDFDILTLEAGSSYGRCVRKTG